MFYLMEKKELNRSYGDFKGWGTAYTQFKNIVSPNIFKDQAELQQRSQSQRQGYSHINSLMKLRNQRNAPVKGLPVLEAPPAKKTKVEIVDPKDQEIVIKTGEQLLSLIHI